MYECLTGLSTNKNIADENLIIEMTEATQQNWC